jgi:hypothetical protein
MKIRIESPIHFRIRQNRLRFGFAGGSPATGSGSAVGTILAIAAV